MKYFTIGYSLPNIISSRLFGNRLKYGTKINYDDPMWLEWEDTYLKFYTSTQKAPLGDMINHAGYHIMNKVNLDGKRVMEIGPGDIRHLLYWQGRPGEYVIADIQQTMLDRSSSILLQGGVTHKQVLLERENRKLPFEDESFDIVVSFYALEHISPLEPALFEIRRVLKAGGLFVGAIPAEGGLAWGLGRLLTSRRWLKKNTGIDPDKIICWEHPSFADTILAELDNKFMKQRLFFWPFRIPLIDINLVISFIYKVA